MWFSKAFGLELDSLKVTEAETVKTHEIYSTLNTEKTEGCLTSDTDISDTDMSRVEQILCLVDKFCVSDEFYHELTMIENGLPRSYLIKQSLKSASFAADFSI